MRAWHGPTVGAAALLGCLVGGGIAPAAGQEATPSPVPAATPSASPAAPAPAQPEAPAAPFRCSALWNEASGEVAILVENTSQSQLVSDGVASLTLIPRDGEVDARYWSPLNLEKGRSATLGEEATLNLDPNGSRSVTVPLRSLRWARQVRGLRPSLDSLKKIVPRGAYQLTLRVASVVCRAPEAPLNVIPE